MSRARVGSFSPPTLVYAQPLSVIHPPDNNFEVVANTQGQAPPNADQTFASLTSGSISDEIAALYQALAEAQALNQ